MRWLLLLDKRYDFNDYYGPGLEGKSKLKWMLTEVYPTTRSWAHWISEEFKLRHSHSLDIKMSHSEFNVDTYSSLYPLVAVTIEPKLAQREIMKFLPGIRMLPDEALGEITEFVDKYKKLAPMLEKRCNVLVIDNTILYKPVLDRNWYNTLINFLYFDDNYEDAAKLHARWYALHEQAGKEVLEEFTRILTTHIDIP